MGLQALTDDGFAALYEGAYVFDGHNDLALRLLDGEDIASRRSCGHLDLPRMRESGYDAAVFAVWIDPERPDPLGRSLEGLATLLAWCDRTDGVRAVLGRHDLETARERDEVAVVPGVEGGYGIRDLADADALIEAGMRCLTLTWMQPTAWADASSARPVHGGLTELGRHLVRRLESRGVAIDLSHASDRVAWDVLAILEAPPIASHSCARALARHDRNLDDSLLEALAAAGGVVGINFFSAYLDEGFAARFEEIRRRVQAEDGTPQDLDAAVLREVPPPTLSHLLDHVEHAVRVAGSAHVGLGTDFEGVTALPREIEDVRGLRRVARGLADRGFDAESLRGVLGENFWRVFHAILP
ncbi:MAG: dipeptidase [Gemmatimonadota bacterium]